MENDLALLKRTKKSVIGLITIAMLMLGMMVVGLQVGQLLLPAQAYAEGETGNPAIQTATITLTDENGEPFAGNATDGYYTTFTGEEISCKIAVKVNGQDVSDFDVVGKDEWGNTVNLDKLYSAGSYVITIESKASSPQGFNPVEVSFEIKPHEVTFAVDESLKSDVVLEYNEAIEFLESHIKIENDIKNDLGIFSPNGIKAWVSIKSVELADNGKTQTIKYTVFVSNSTNNQVVKSHDIQIAVVELSEKAFPDVRTYVNADIKQGNRIVHNPEENGNPYTLVTNVWVQETYLDPDTNLVKYNRYNVTDDQYALEITNERDQIVQPDSIIEKGEYTVAVVPRENANFPAPETFKINILESTAANLSSELRIKVNPFEVEYDGKTVDAPDVITEAYIDGEWMTLSSDLASIEVLGNRAEAGTCNIDVCINYKTINNVEYFGYVTFEDVFTIKKRPISKCCICFNEGQLTLGSTVPIPSSYVDQLAIEDYIYDKLDIYHDDSQSQKIYGATSDGDLRSKSYIVTADVEKKEFTITGSWNYTDAITYSYELVDETTPVTPPSTDVPTSPVDPVPSIPVIPNPPAEPENPDIPEEPTDPEAPEVPDDSSEPVAPDTPDTPSEPDPIVPTDPETPSTGWVETDTGWQYKDENGEAAADTWQKVNGNWYHFDNTGTMQTGWVKDNNTWYYLNKADEGTEGAMAKGWKQVDNTWYYLDNSGAMQTGWQNINGAWYHLNTSGAMQTGWVKDNDTWYYCNKNGEGTEGKMVVGWKEVDNTWYYFNTSGAMQTGWQKVNGSWYYLSASGAMQTGWQQIDGAWYYLNPADGAMAANTWISNYYVDASGKWVSSR